MKNTYNTHTKKTIKTYQDKFNPDTYRYLIETQTAKESSSLLLNESNFTTPIKQYEDNNFVPLSLKTLSNNPVKGLARYFISTALAEVIAKDDKLQKQLLDGFFYDYHAFIKPLQRIFGCYSPIMLANGDKIVELRALSDIRIIGIKHTVQDKKDKNKHYSTFYFSEIGLHADIEANILKVAVSAASFNTKETEQKLYTLNEETLKKIDVLVKNAAKDNGNGLNKLSLQRTNPYDKTAKNLGFENLQQATKAYEVCTKPTKSSWTQRVLDTERKNGRSCIR